MKTPPGRKQTSRHKILRDHNRLAACVIPKQAPLPTEAPVVYSPPAPSPESIELRHAAKSVQALAVMVQYLVHEVDAFAAPCLKRQLSGVMAAWRSVSLERDELLAGHGRLQEDLLKLKTSFGKQLEELQEKHVEELDKVRQQCKEDGEREFSEQEQSLSARYESSMANIQGENTKFIESLNQNHEQVVVRLEHEHQQQMSQLEEQYKTQLVDAQVRFDSVETQYMKGKLQYRTMLESMQSDKDSRLQTTAYRCKELQDEVDSLRTVLELRQQDLQDLRHKNAIYEREKEEQQSEINKNLSLQAKIEDLTAQLVLKSNEERRLSVMNRRLNESFVHESYHSKRLSQHNEELMWKLRTQSELCDQLASGRSDIDMTVKSYLHQCNTTTESCPDDIFGKTQLSSSENSPLHKTSYLERSDSVSWTFEMEDPVKPHSKGSGAVRRIRSFQDSNSSLRHVKSPNMTREKRRSAIESGNYFSDWPQSSSTPQKHCSNDESDSAEMTSFMEVQANSNRPCPTSGSSSLDSGPGVDEALPLPALSTAVPVPKDAAGEAMISEETSEEDDLSQHTTDEESSSEVALS